MHANNVCIIGHIIWEDYCKFQIPREGPLLLQNPNAVGDVARLKLLELKADKQYKLFAMWTCGGHRR